MVMSSQPGSPWTNKFFVAAGTIIGREHVRLGKNNQDKVIVSVRDDSIVAVVTDGCGSGNSSEVGAALIATWLGTWLPLYGEKFHS